MIMVNAGALHTSNSIESLDWKQKPHGFIKLDMRTRQVYAEQWNSQERSNIILHIITYVSCVAGNEWTNKLHLSHIK